MLRIVNELCVDDWSSFVSAQQNGNIFQTPEMFDLYRQTERLEPVFVAVIDDANVIQGVQLSVIQKEHKGFLGTFSARAIIWGGPLVKEDNPDVLDRILGAYNKKIKGKAIYSQYRNLWEWASGQKKVFEKHGFGYEAHLNILIDLNVSANDLFTQMTSSRRRNIRKAERVPLEFHICSNREDYSQSYEIIRSTYEKVKLPCPDLPFFASAMDLLEESGRFKIFATRFQGEIIACRFALFYKNRIYDWYAGANDDHLYKYPNDYLPWKIMEWGMAHGYEIFDFGGAGKPDVPYGVRDHKLKFGGRLAEFGRFNQVHNIILMRLGEFLLKLYKRIK
jgi:lipid II:glycine glycyltransferase (peptidoglycan interpeptide bridge formation enzyme)